MRLFIIRHVHARFRLEPRRAVLFDAALAANDRQTAKEMLDGIRAAQPTGVETWWLEYLYVAAASDIVTAERNLRLVLDMDPTAQSASRALQRHGSNSAHFGQVAYEY